MSTDGNLCTEGRALRVPTWRNILVLLLVIEIASVLSENGCAIQSEICVRVSEAYKTTITQQYRKFYSKQLSFVIRTIFAFMKCYMGEGGGAVAQLVEALRYKREGCGFDSRWCHWNFSLT